MRCFTYILTWLAASESTVGVRWQLKVLNNQLFGIEPKKGRLCPGETCSVTLTYKHVMIGTDRLPVTFKLSRGREIRVRQCFI